MEELWNKCILFFTSKIASLPERQLLSQSSLAVNMSFTEEGAGCEPGPLSYGYHEHWSGTPALVSIVVTIFVIYLNI